MARSKEQHPSQGPGSPGVPGDVATPEAIKEHMAAVGDGMGNAVKAVRDIEAAQAATVKVVQDVPEDVPDGGLAQTAGRNTSIRQITFASPSPYTTLAAAFDAVKAKALSFDGKQPEVRLEIAGNEQQGFTANALLTFTSVYDDPQAALVS